MSLCELLEGIKSDLSIIEEMKVLGIIVRPYFNDKNMSCYTSLDLGNPGLLDINRGLSGDYLKVSCIHSQGYVGISNNKNIRKRPASENCKGCNFTPSNADYFEVIIDCILDGKFDNDFKEKLTRIMNDIGKKFNINIQMCTIKPKNKEVGIE